MRKTDLLCVALLLLLASGCSTRMHNPVIVDTAGESGMTGPFLTEVPGERIIQQGRSSLLDIAPDSQAIALRDSNSAVRIVNLKTGWHFAMGADVAGVAFSPDATLIATSGKKGVFLYSVADGSLVRKVSANEQFTRVSFSQSGGRLLLQGKTHFRVINVQDGQLVFEQELRSDCPVMMTPDGDRLAASSYKLELALDGVFRLYDLANGRIISETVFEDGLIRNMAVSNDGRLVALHTAGTGLNLESFLTVFDASTGKKVFSWNGAGAEHMAFSPDNTLLVTATKYMGVLNIYDLRNGSKVKTLDSQGSISAIAFSPDSRYLAIGAYNTALYYNDNADIIYDLRANKAVYSHLGQGHISGIGFLPDESGVVSTGSYGARFIPTEQFISLKTAKAAHE